MPPVKIDCRNREPFEIGIELDVLLCFPTWPAERRERIARGLCEWFLKTKLEFERDLHDEFHARYPHYLRGVPRVELKGLFDRRERALIAGKVMLPFMKLPEIKEAVVLDGEPIVPTRGLAIRYLYASELNVAADEVDALHSIAKHKVRPWDPVVHLAASWQAAAYELSGVEMAARLDYQDVELHRRVVERAGRYAGHIRNIPTLRKVAVKLIDIEWVD